MASIVAGLVALPTMDTISGDPRIEVVAKSNEPGVALFRITRKNGVKPEVVQPLLAGCAATSAVSPRNSRPPEVVRGTEKGELLYSAGKP